MKKMVVQVNIDTGEEVTLRDINEETRERSEFHSIGIVSGMTPTVLNHNWRGPVKIAVT